MPLLPIFDSLLFIFVTIWEGIAVFWTYFDFSFIVTILFYLQDSLVYSALCGTLSMSGKI